MIVRVLSTLLFGIFLLLCSWPILGQNTVIEGEYFWDVDPGQGNGTTVVASDGNFDETLEEVLINSSTLPTTGLHSLHIRIKGQDGSWSPLFSQVINIQGTPLSTGHQINITAAEYFWDIDPGQGNGTALLAFDGNFDQALETAFTNAPTTLPTVGLHTLHIRVLGQDGTWSSTFVQVINIQNTPLTTGHQINITAAEYFWDIDPGQGNGTALLAFDGNFDQAIETAFSNAPATLPANGLHTFHIRVLGQDGAWSPPFVQVMNVAATPLATGHQINLTAAEYFWDVDPGQGNGTALLAFDGNFDQAIETAFSNAPATLPANGLHTFHIRVLGQDGAWSPPFVQVMNVAATPLATGHQINLTAAEYFWDIDPGQGNGTALLAFDGNFNQALEIVGDNLPTFSLTLGPHALYTRIQGQDGTWSPPFGVVVEIDTSLVPIISNVVGDSVFCSNSTLTNLNYSTNSQPNATYNWTIIGGSIVGSSTTSVVVVDWDTMATTHELRLQACNSFGCGNTFVKTVLIAPNPSNVISTNTGRDSFCFGDSLTLTASSGNYTYNWTTGATTASVVATNSATYQVTITDALSGCISVAQKTVTEDWVDTTVVVNGFTLTATATNATVQWLDCATNLPVAGATNASFSPTGNGLYAALVTQNGCQDTSSCYDITFISTTRLSSQEMPAIQVYPNPNKGLFTIDFGTYASPNAHIELLNALGQIVYQTTRQSTLQSIEKVGLPTGVYMLRIDRQVTNRIIIEQH
ncbi:MAG: T9SS type A sorting domain-containing protein [Aureispira sp.]